jgi:2-methylcitrate dehydratase PrpD
MGITEKLARFAIDTPASAIPPAVFESAKLKYLDTLGVMVAGSRHPAAAIALDTVRYLGGNARASIIGHAERTSTELAGFMNGVSAHALEYDDYTRMVTHLSVSMAPGTLALAEDTGASGQHMLESFAIGFQVATHVAKGLRPWLFDKGWHPNGILGAIGVAVAGARLMKLDVLQTRMAIGIAASEASGLRKNVGSMGKPFHVGHGIRCGIFAALLAARGYTVDPDIIEGVEDGVEGHERFGMADTFNGVGQYDLAKMEAGLARDWHLADNQTVVRFHPGATGQASAIDGMIDLVREHDIQPGDVERIDLEVTAQVMSIGSYRTADDGHKARFCLTYGMAVALIDRAAGLAQYSDERVRRGDVQALMKRVSVSVPDDFRRHKGQWGEGVNWGEMRLAVVLKSGKRHSVSRSHARGWPEQPATWDDVAVKFRECCAGILPESQSARALQLIHDLEHSDLRELIDVLRPPNAGKGDRQ